MSEPSFYEKFQDKLDEARKARDAAKVEYLAAKRGYDLALAKARAELEMSDDARERKAAPSLAKLKTAKQRQAADDAKLKLELLESVVKIETDRDWRKIRKGAYGA